MKRWILIIQVLLLIIGICFLFAFAQHENKEKNLVGIEVAFLENNPVFVSAEMVNKLLIQSEINLLNKPKTMINLHQLEASLVEDNMIEDAEVYITPLGKLHAEVIQRKPLVRINAGSRSYYLDRKGTTMPLSANYTARVPLVTGVSNNEMEQEVFHLIQLLEADGFFRKQIIGIHRKLNGDYLLSTRIGRHKVLLGKLENTEDKLKKLRVFYNKEWNSETLNTYELINLKYKHQVVCS